MTKALTALVICAALYATSNTLAGGYGGYHGGYHGGFHGGHHGGHAGIHYGYHGSGHDVLGIIVGGLLFGPLLHYALSDRGHHHHHPEYRPAYRTAYPVYSRGYTTYRTVRTARHTRAYREPVYVEVSPPGVTRRSTSAGQRTHLHRDRHGDCFEIRYDRQGREFRKRLSPETCDW